jgi:predicted dehydrogenase
MDSRRSFIKKMGKGVALSSLALSSASAYASKLADLQDNKENLIRIGIIGAENSHTIDYGNIFNTENKFPGAEVRYVWGETEEFARNAMREGNIPEMVKDPLAMLGKIDALIVDHRHPKYHLQAAEPFVKAGIPTFIDKPFCYRVVEGKAFLAMARKAGTPVTSYSSLAQSYATYDLKEQVASMGEINHIISCGPADLDSIYGGIFFYGIHIIQPLMMIFGENILKVRVSRNGKTSGASLVFSNGRLATLVFKNLSGGWETFVDTKDGLVKLIPRVEETNPGKNYADMVEMFRTGKEPISQSNILSPIAVLEALEKSALSDTWEEVPSIV